MYRVPSRIQRLLLGLDVVNASGIDFERLAEREWSSEDHAPGGLPLKPAVRQLPRSHLDARFAAAMASEALE